MARRMRELELPRVSDYRDYLAAHPEEWARMDAFCRITISRFYRDRRFFSALGEDVLPQLARRVTEGGRSTLRVWSSGCASGEEPYTISLLWRFGAVNVYPALALKVVATDADASMLRRAAAARYRYGSLKELPAPWRETAFRRVGADYVLAPQYRRPVSFVQQDLRVRSPKGPFDLVLCRNLAFTYYDSDLQRDIVERISGVTVAGGVLGIGSHEHLPAGQSEFCIYRDGLSLYKKNDAGRAE